MLRVTLGFCLVAIVCGLLCAPAPVGLTVSADARSTQIDVMTVFLPEPEFADPVTVLIAIREGEASPLLEAGLEELSLTGLDALSARAP